MNIENYISAIKKIEEMSHQVNNAINQVLGALQAEYDLMSNNTNNGVSTPTDNSANIPASIIPDVRKINNKEQETMPKLKHIYIYKREKYYYVQVIYKGLKKSFTRKNKNNAIKDAKECLEDFINQANPTSISTLNNIATFYLENLKKPFISSDYYNSLINRYNNHVKEKLGNLKVQNITPIILQEYFKELTSYSTRMAEDVKTLLTQVFEYAVGCNFLKVNPMRAVLVKKHERINGQALSQEELKEFKKNIDNTKYKIGFYILLYTGVRATEYKTLEFNFEENTVTIKNAKLKQHQKEKYRTIPILKPLLEYKEEIIKGEWKNLSIDEITRRYKTYAKNGRLNYLRHTFQTYCSLKASNELVNYWAGHTLGKDTTSRVYLHFPMEYQQEIASNIIY